MPHLDPNPTLTAERLRQLLHYDPKTGIFVWISPLSNRVKSGDVAGYRRRNAKSKKLEWGIGVEGRQYLAGRLAWLYMTGEWPTALVDHFDGNPDNQRWENLRSATHTMNMENQREASKNNLSGYLGVSWEGRSGKWFSRITVGRVVHRLGYFESAEDAHQAYLEAKRRLHAGCTI